MTCPKCNSSNTNVQMVTQIKNKGRSIIWWIAIGWWWVIIKWTIFTLPALIFKILAPKKQKAVHISVRVCQDCGNNWRV